MQMQALLDSFEKEFYLPSSSIQIDQILPAPESLVGCGHQKDPTGPPHQLLVILASVLLPQFGSLAISCLLGLLFGEAIAQEAHLAPLSTLGQANPAFELLETVGSLSPYLLLQEDGLALLIF